MPRKKHDLADMFSTLYVEDPITSCWMWRGAVSSDGYPLYAHRRVTRWVCETFHGSTGQFLACHRCHTPLCVNPEHLYAGTPRMNMQDAQDRGTFDNLGKGRDAHWASQSHEERSARAQAGADGVRRYMASLTQSERSAIARRAALARWSR